MIIRMYLRNSPRQFPRGQFHFVVLIMLLAPGVENNIDCDPLWEKQPYSLGENKAAFCREVTLV